MISRCWEQNGFDPRKARQRAEYPTCRANPGPPTIDRHGFTVKWSPLSIQKSVKNKLYLWRLFGPLSAFVKGQPRGLVWQRLREVPGREGRLSDRSGQEAPAMTKTRPAALTFGAVRLLLAGRDSDTLITTMPFPFNLSTGLGQFQIIVIPLEPEAKGRAGGLPPISCSEGLMNFRLSFRNRLQY